jgi:hypothetical protein
MIGLVLSELFYNAITHFSIYYANGYPIIQRSSQHPYNVLSSVIPERNQITDNFFSVQKDDVHFLL